jgi:predicted NUDIX family phosphoesterase
VTEHVLVVPTRVLHEAGLFHGFSDRVGHYLPRLLDTRHLLYLPRDQAEQDPSFKQLIPYVVLRHGGEVFHYRRAGGGEKRLHTRRSIGLGGHICAADGTAPEGAYEAGMRRELREEVELPVGYSERLVGLINDDRTPVGQVHLGIVHVLDLTVPRARSREAALVAGGFAPLGELRRDALAFETWSQFLLDGPWLEGGPGGAAPVTASCR